MRRGSPRVGAQAERQPASRQVAGDQGDPQEDGGDPEGARAARGGVAESRAHPQLSRRDPLLQQGRAGPAAPHQREGAGVRRLCRHGQLEGLPEL